jgi:hypothetical protein
VSAEYAGGILTIKVALKSEHQEGLTKIPVSVSEK